MTHRNIVLELIAIAFLATGGIFVKISSLPPITTGFYRVVFSLPLLFPFVRKKILLVSRKDWIILFFAGVFLAGDISLWNISFSYTSVAHANLLTNLTPLTVIPVAFFLFKERMPRFFFIGTIITFTGVFLLVSGTDKAGTGTFRGDLSALSASFFYAGFLLITYRLRSRIESSVIMFISGIGSAITLFLTSCCVEGFRIPQGMEQLWPLIALTLSMQIIGHNLLAHCQGNLPVALSSVLCLAQPAIAALYAFFIFSEVPGPREILGIIIVITGIFLIKYSSGKSCIKKPLSETNNV